MFRYFEASQLQQLPNSNAHDDDDISIGKPIEQFVWIVEISIRNAVVNLQKIWSKSNLITTEFNIFIGKTDVSIQNNSSKLNPTTAAIQYAYHDNDICIDITDGNVEKTWRKSNPKTQNSILLLVMPI